MTDNERLNRLWDVTFGPNGQPELSMIVAFKMLQRELRFLRWCLLGILGLLATSIIERAVF